MQCVKSIVEQYPNFRPTIIRKIIENLDEITSADAMKVALWLLGEYSDAKDVSTNEAMLSDAFEAIRSLLGIMIDIIIIYIYVYIYVYICMYINIYINICIYMYI
jgi:hypothetical protein